VSKFGSHVVRESRELLRVEPFDVFVERIDEHGEG